ncbi:CBD9-like protein [Fomitiporia mediterranea MF3/22]|uniref:CBD9-like protein n=1 Tax=Fomitiporia mediterranea (strain MF3/22) TaxID=694068 RepID=UPI00044092A5|nr:CBD9-like protein [Fomitiporia mediterranea MF3/22]EJD02578.1 CBD9-like protein [Fomitiporia mediterranea MF3/22]
MCVSAVVNGSTVEYVLQSTGSKSLGWMAMGFGSQMANSPMVIMWTNSDGSVTLSQRKATGEVEPSVDSAPPRTATWLSNLTSTSDSNPKFGYSIPANSDTKQSIIWAFSSTNPGDSSTSANLQIHDSSGTLSLDLTKSLSSGSSTTDPASGGSGSASSPPLLPFQKMVIAHAVLLGIAFLIFLPAGALLARWFRTFTPNWFKGHWIIQFYVAGTLIVIGVALGIAAVSKAGANHLNDDHKRWGIAIFVLYFAQCALGGIIHFVKSPPKADGTRTRPPQNYAHAILGLLVIGLAFYQVRTGYREEWPLIRGGRDAPASVNRAWIAWVVILPILYFAGLALLPRQYKQERGAQTGRGVPLTPLSSNSPRTRTVHIGEPTTTAVDQHNIKSTGLSPVDEHGQTSPSSHGHGDPYADDVGLTQDGRRNRRTSNNGFSLRPSSPRNRYSGSFGNGVSMPSNRF